MFPSRRALPFEDVEPTAGRKDTVTGSLTDHCVPANALPCTIEIVAKAKGKIPTTLSHKSQATSRCLVQINVACARALVTVKATIVPANNVSISRLIAGTFLPLFNFWFAVFSPRPG